MIAERAESARATDSARCPVKPALPIQRVTVSGAIVAADRFRTVTALRTCGIRAIHKHKGAAESGSGVCPQRKTDGHAAATFSRGVLRVSNCEKLVYDFVHGQRPGPQANSESAPDPSGIEN